MKIEGMLYENFIKKLNDYHIQYDDDVKMLKGPFTSPGYHTTLKGGTVHRTRESLVYALALLDSELEEYQQRAFDILRQVMLLQDTDAEHNTYGIWPWFYEEPLEKMSPPDWNWADFCGKYLLEIAIDHGNKLSETLKNEVKASIYHAANSIIRRNVGPEYTNIAIMGTFVTMVSGELYGWKEISLYGKQRLNKLHAHTMSKGAFNEYNSPAYTVIALEELARLLNHVRDEECLTYIRDLYNIGWRCLATHFHTHTRQWAGPHARSYSSLEGTLFWSMIQLATKGKTKFLADEALDMNIEWFRLNMFCPEGFQDYFENGRYPRTESEICEEGNGELPPKVATCYMNAKYTVGTFSQMDLWNQRRAFIAYWGSYKEPQYMHLRCLHDGYDYCSAVMTAVQYEGNVLAAINFATDGGDTHVDLDKIKNAAIKAKDLRIRLELGGGLENISLPKKWDRHNTVICATGDIFIKAKVPYCKMGDHEISFEISRDSQKAYLDIILYRGQEKEICFDELEEAVCLLAVAFNEDKDKTYSDGILKAEKFGDVLVSTWEFDSQRLELQMPTEAQTKNEIFASSKRSVFRVH